MLTIIDNHDEEMKLIVHKISSICLSTEFQELCRELEAVYRQCSMDNPTALAFQDALYSMLTDGEEMGSQRVQMH